MIAVFYWASTVEMPEVNGRQPAGIRRYGQCNYGGSAWPVAARRQIDNVRSCPSILQPRAVRLHWQRRHVRKGRLRLVHVVCLDPVLTCTEPWSKLSAATKRSYDQDR